MDFNPGILGISELRIPVPWGHVAGKAWGDPVNGKPVLAVHGLLDNAGTFDALIPLLPKSLYIVSIDIPGHGHSSHLPAGIPYHYIDFVATIKRVVTYLKWTRFYYIGHSMGASLGIMYGIIFPDEIERLILLDLVRPITNPSDECAEAMKTGIQNFLAFDTQQTEDDAGKPISYTYEMILKRLMLATQYSHYPLTEAAAKIMLIRGSRRVTENEYTNTRDNRMMSTSILLFSHEQLSDMVKELKCHVLAIKASEASWFQPEYLCENVMKIYREICPSFKFLKVIGNHFLHLNNAYRVARSVGEFFTYVLSKSTSTAIEAR